MKRIRTDPDPEHWPVKGVIYTPVYLVVRGNSSPEGPDGGQVDVQHLEAILAQHVLNNVKKIATAILNEHTIGIRIFRNDLDIQTIKF